jgi:hypothetical protein
MCANEFDGRFLTNSYSTSAELLVCCYPIYFFNCTYISSLFVCIFLPSPILFLGTLFFKCVPFPVVIDSVDVSILLVAKYFKCFSYLDAVSKKLELLYFI